MSPEAKIRLPAGISEEDLQELIAPIKGKIVSFKEINPIEVQQISPITLADFLLNQIPNLNLPAVWGSYIPIFRVLRSLSPQTQEKLLVRFYTEGVKDFPHGEAVGKALAEINNIPWFSPESQPSITNLENLSNQALFRLNLNKLPLRIIKDDWQAAEQAAEHRWDGGVWDTAQKMAEMETEEAAEKATRGMAWHMAKEATWYSTWHMAQEAAWHTISKAVQEAALRAARYTEWIVVGDLMRTRGYDKGNPFKPLMEIYELGCWPIGAVLDPTTKKEEFVVFIPPIQKTV